MSYSIGFDIFAKDRASEKFDHVGDSASRTGGRLKKFGVVAAAGVAVAAAAVGKFAKDSIEASQDAQRSQRILDDAYARFPKLADVHIDKMRELGAAMQKKTKFDGDDINAAQGVLASYKLTGKQVMELTPLLADYAEKTGKDIPAAAKDLGNAMLGKGKALAGIGVKFKDLKDPTKNYNQLVKGLRTNVGGFAEKEGKTLEGRLATLKNNFGDVKEAVGAALIPVLTRLAGWFISSGLPAVQRFGGWISGRLWPALKQGYQTIMPALRQALAIVTGGVDGGSVSWKKIGAVITDKVIPFLAKLISVYLPILATNLRTGIEVVKTMYRAFETWRTIVGSVISFILRRFADMATMWAGVLRALGKVPGFGWAKDAAKKMQTAADKANGIANAIDNIPSSKKVTVTVTARTQTGRIKVGNEYVNVGAFAKGGRNIPPGWKWVGEDGPELMWTPGGDHVIPNGESERLTSGGRGSGALMGGGDDRPIIVQLVADGQVLQQVLLKRKRQTGTALGLA